MDEFLKKVRDLYNRVENKNIMTYTGFLTPTEQQVIRNNFSKSKVEFFGGNEKAERVRAFFLPDYMEEILFEDYIKVFHATFSFKKLSHRDFLGAILNLGIKRECVGDIYVFDKEAYFFVTPEVKDFIKLNLTKIGSVGVKLREVEFDKVKIPEQKFDEVRFTVQSLRLDSVVSGIFNESREKMNLKIREGIVLLNYLVCQNTSEAVREGDVISIRGYGKAIIYEIGGITRRGKTVVVARKFK